MNDDKHCDKADKIDASEQDVIKRVVLFTKLSENAYAPTYGSEWSAGADLYSAHDYLIPAKDKFCVATDLQLEIPRGFYGRIAPRSGLALKNFIDVGAGVVDSDYRGNLKVLLFNFGSEDFQGNSCIRRIRCVLKMECKVIIFGFLFLSNKTKETMEGLISQHKQLDDMASSSGVNDGHNEDAGSTEKKTSLGPRKERSLTVVCDRVINVFMENGVTNIGELSNRSGQRVRRIYDVLNIFQALGLIDKAGGRKFNWRGTNGLNETLHRFRIESDDGLWNSFINFCKENSSMNKSVVTSKKRKFDENPQSAGSSKMNILVKATEFFVKIVMQAKENSMHVHNQELLLTLIEEKKDIFKEDTLSRRLYDIKNILMHIGLLETIETRSKKKNKKVNCFRFINGTKFKWDEESNNNPSNPDREEQSSSLAASANEEPSLTEEDGRFQSDLAGPSRPALCDLSNVENVVRKTSTPFSMDDILAVPDKSNICLPPLCPSWSAQSDLSDAENVVRKTNTPFSVDNILSSPEKIRRPSFAPCVQNANTGSPVNTFCPVSRAQTFSGHTYHQNTNPGFVGVASLQYLNALALLQNMNGRFVGPSSFRGMNAFVGIQSMNALGSIQNLNALALLQNMNGGKRIE